MDDWRCVMVVRDMVQSVIMDSPLLMPLSYVDS